jgi:hypothetical protein
MVSPSALYASFILPSCSYYTPILLLPYTYYAFCVKTWYVYSKPIVTRLEIFRNRVNLCEMFLIHLNNVHLALTEIYFYSGSQVSFMRPTK